MCSFASQSDRFEIPLSKFRKCRKKLLMKWKIRDGRKKRFFFFLFFFYLWKKEGRGSSLYLVVERRRNFNTVSMKAHYISDNGVFIESGLDIVFQWIWFIERAEKTNVSRRMIHEWGGGAGKTRVINGAVCSAYQRGVLMFVISSNNFTRGLR